LRFVKISGQVRLSGLATWKADEERAVGVGGGGFCPDGLRGVVLDLFAGGRIVALGDVAEPDFEEIGELRHRADGGA
jgi:hypothetical protein